MQARVYKRAPLGGRDRRAWRLKHVLQRLRILGRLATIVIVEQDIRRLAGMSPDS
jgi:hypothetical protein